MKLRLEDGKYYFDAEDGTAPVECRVYVETSKKNEKHPEGKPWIVLPKNNPSNRAYISEDLFNEQAVNDCLEVTVKTNAPRVLGTKGVKQTIVKYLNEEDAAEYKALVEGAIEKFRAAKANTKKKKPEEMGVEELEAYIAALKEGKTLTAVKNGPKSFIDVFTDEEYARYNELLGIAQENKANAPKAKRGPLTDEEKAARKVKRLNNDITKAEALLAALKAGVTVDEDEDIIDEDEE